MALVSTINDEQKKTVLDALYYGLSIAEVHSGSMSRKKYKKEIDCIMEAIEIIENLK